MPAKKTSKRNAKKNTPGKGKIIAKQSKKLVRKLPQAKSKTSKSTLSPISALVNELATLRNTVKAQLKANPPTGLIDEVDAIRRVLSDIIESRNSGSLQKLAAIRHSVSMNSNDTLSQIDSLMLEMGAITFEADRLDHLDPVIHSVGREVQNHHLPDGVIVETSHLGCRTARGLVLTKAVVAINRRT
jgi:molecular chaperone GrpE (heat shock protein)